MKIVLAFLLLIATSLCQAQTAKVVELTPQEAAEAKSLYHQQKEIQDKITALQKQIEDKYLVARKDNCINYGYDKESNLCNSFKDGWTFGLFEFSEDYRFIVPMPNLITTNQSYQSCGGTFYSSPMMYNNVLSDDAYRTGH